jgi:hypothetical protein
LACYDHMMDHPSCKRCRENDPEPLRADLATANATIDAQAVDLLMVRSAMRTYLTLDGLNAITPEMRTALAAILAAPAAHRRGAEILEAADILLGPEPLVRSGNTVAEHLMLIRAYCRTRIAEPHADDCPVMAYRRLRGDGTAASGEEACKS